ncbi:hypothetical protein [Acidicapsa ligni]|uniref:hypothetical protein n=1 Tax=Acidicapsa ligni TaxID=542300 RepID=UPI0021DFAB78|nr:hypothetical protein [Acidicapsa ligni]
MPETSLLQIVSGFKPNVDGMGDFARLIGEALWQKKSIQSHFVVYRRPNKSFDPQEILPNTISYLDESTPAELSEHLVELCAQRKFDNALVHYGAYAYSREGKPAEFGKVIEELAKKMPVSIFFHEVQATAMPWKRAFWTFPEQRKTAMGLVRCAKVSFTSNSEYVKTLERFKVPGAVITKAPVISNVGEPTDPRPLKERARQLVIFGQFSNRIRIYEKHRQLLEDVCKLLRIQTVVDVGSGQSPSIPSTVAGAEVKRGGWMDEQQVSVLMSDSIAGLVCYAPDIWEKSGVIAAYQAHALVPILVPLQKRLTPEPAYLPYVSCEALSRLATADGVVPEEQLQTIATDAHRCYVANQSVNACVEAISDVLTRS